jgi:hypothetical protein
MAIICGTMFRVPRTPEPSFFREKRGSGLERNRASVEDGLEALQSRLPNFTLEWFPDVAFPAFETKHQIIWKRSPNQTGQPTAAAPGG